MTLVPWERIAADKRERLSKSLALTHPPCELPKGTRAMDIPKIVLGERESMIVHLSPESLLVKLASGELTAVEVTASFCKSAALAHQLINCLCETMFDTALNRARELDRYLKDTGKTVGPLHGLPISLKNQISVKGVEMNMCYVGRVGEIAESDSTMASILLQQGAVLYTLTNLSQGLLSTDTVNNLYGRTVSPFNASLCVGGSSGGEGGLIALHGSPLGIGSDLGGSVRIPAAFNGLYGFRPSSHRLPYNGSRNSQEGQISNASCLGPLSPTLQGIKILVQAILAAEPWRHDPLALRMPWNDSLYNLDDRDIGSLCFAMSYDNGHVIPNPPYLRAMAKVEAALGAKGHGTIRWNLPRASQGNDFYLAQLIADGGEDLRRSCATSAEPVLGGTLKGLTRKTLSTLSWWDLVREKNRYLARQLEAWNETSILTGTGRPVDAIVMPVAPYPSFLHGDREYVYYTAVSNLSDYPTAVFPVTFVNPSVDLKQPRAEFLSDWDREIHERYNPQLFAGMPIGLQVIGRKGEDEAVIRLTEIIVEALKLYRM